MIRLLTRKDRKQLSRIIKSASQENMFIITKKKQFIGYFIDNQLVGIVGFYLLNDLKMIGFISAYTLPKHRRKGIYDNLAKFRMDYVKKHFQGYTIYVTTNNKSKKELEKFGFTIIEPQYRMKYDIKI